MKLLKKYWPAVAILIVIFGMLLRFYRINDMQSFGWDQGRDAWLTRDVIQGKLVLNGPRTGVGHFHLGPLWYYLLAPFYLATGLDPIAANYLNFVVNLFNFAAIFWVTKKILKLPGAFFVTFFYATNQYLVNLGRVAWNVSPVPGVAALIFYCIYEIVYENKYKLVFLLSFLSGLFFHLHFSVVFLPFIILTSFVLAKDKLKLLKYSLLSLPLALVWIIPEVMYELSSKNTNINLFSNFLKDYFIDGFHVRFFIHRLYDGFIQFETLLSLPKTSRFWVLIVPAIYVALLIFDKDKRQKILGYLTMVWFIVPSIGYAYYAGSTSEYYMLMSAMLVIYIVYYIFNRILNLKPKALMVIPIFMLLTFSYYQLKGITSRRIEGGLNKQKQEVRDRIKNNDKIGYSEGDIKSYMWHIWVEDKK